MMRKPSMTGLAGTLAKTLSGGLLAATAALAPAAHAGVLTFEGASYQALVNGYNPADNSVDIANTYYQQGNYVFGSYTIADGATPGEGLTGFFSPGSDPTSCLSSMCPTNNPTDYLSIVNDSIFDLFMADGTAFRLPTLSASWIGDINQSYASVAGILRLRGYRANGSFSDLNINMAGPTNGNFLFRNYNTGAWGNNYFTEVLAWGYTCNSAGQCSSFGSNKGQFALDNMQVVPEPASLAILGLGAVGLIASRRRRARAA